MSKKHINQNFYTIDGLKHERITKEDREKMTPEQYDYWKDLDYWYVKKKLSDRRLFAGWGVSHPTKITAEDLPPDYIEVTNYKKHGYIRTAGVKSLIYKPSPFHNHTFKDDVLYISYTKDLGEYVGGDEENSTYNQCDEYLFGNDIIDFIHAMSMWSPDYDTTDIKQRIIDQYNAYCDEMAEWDHFNIPDKIKTWEELL